MKAETASYLAKAGSDQEEARVAASVGLDNVAARSAYFAMFHVAEAFIFEHTGRTPKTHSGVRTEFARLSREEVSIDPSFRRSLAQFYIYKETADYAISDPLRITSAEVEAAIDTASRFLNTIETLLGKET